MERKSSRHRMMPAKLQDYADLGVAQQQSGAERTAACLQNLETSSLLNVGKEALGNAVSVHCQPQQDVAAEKETHACHAEPNNISLMISPDDNSEILIVSERRFRCSIPECRKQFTTATALDRHCRQVHIVSSSDENGKTLSNEAERSQIYMCEYCSRTFKQQSNLKLHIRMHNGGILPRFQCSVVDCERVFTSSNSLHRHKLTHMGVKLYVCDLCKKSFSSNLALSEHIALHNGLRPYTCAECTRSFRQISCFKRHLMTHSNIRDFHCDICQCSFSQASYLRSHMRKHTGEAPYQCRVCQKCFKHASDKNRHMSVHSGEKRYSCGVCSARFKDPSSCRRHVREHSVACAHVCQTCSAAFKRSSQLKNHILHSKCCNQQVNTMVIGPRCSAVSASDLLPSDSKTEPEGNVSVVTLDCLTTSVETGLSEKHLIDGNTVQPNDETLFGREEDNSLASTSTCFLTESLIITDSISDFQPTFVVPENNNNSSASNSVKAEQLPSGTSGTATENAAENGLNGHSFHVTFTDLVNARLSEDLPLEISPEVDLRSGDTCRHFSSTSVEAMMLRRPSSNDENYIAWHVHFMETVLRASLPLSAEMLQQVCVIWTSLVTELDCVGSQHFDHLAAIVKQLGHTVDAHLSALQSLRSS